MVGLVIYDQGGDGVITIGLEWMALAPFIVNVLSYVVPDPNQGLSKKTSCCIPLTLSPLEIRFASV
jgi:hypothetical protein